MKGTKMGFLRGRNFPVPGIIKIRRSTTDRSFEEQQSGGAAALSCRGSGIILLEETIQQTDAAAAADKLQPPLKVSGVASPESTLGAHGLADSLEESSAASESPRPAAAEAAGEPSTSSSQAEPVMDRSRSSSHVAKFEKLLTDKMVDLEALRQVAWSGIPPHLRPLTWRLLLGYLPPNQDRRAPVLQRKRREYLGIVHEFSRPERSAEELAMLHQVEIDAPRTAPGEPFFHQPAVQTALQRILYLWGLRHPASGYVQGINDLVTPFLGVFLSEHFVGPMDDWDVTALDEALLMDMEADCYWCLCKLLDSIQDHYTYAQPGIQRKVFRLKELVRRIDEPLAKHLEAEGVEFMLFAHRWVNCLLVREVPLALGIRLWDTYLAEIEDFGEFLVYACAAFLLMWAKQLRGMEFQDLMMLLQKMPTAGWGENQVETVLSRAFLWRASFGSTRGHLGR